MRIALVRSPTPRIIDPTLYPPTGLAYIAGAVDVLRPGVRVDVLDFAAGTMDDVTDAVAGKYDVVGMTVVSPYWDEESACATAIRELGILVVAGGPHPTVCPSETLESGCFDVIFTGAGELSFCGFIDDFRRGFHRKLYHAVESDLDALPLPRLVTGHGDRGNIILSSRGCVNRCAFCSGGICFPRVQLHSAERVLEEVDRLVESGAASFRFLDDMFAISLGRLAEICAGLAKRGVPWSCHTRVDRALPEVVNMMARSGCYEIGLGVESFDQRVLDVCNKNTTVEENVAAIETVHAHGIDCHVYLMIGTPGESATTADVNISWLRKLAGKFDRLQFSSFMPFPGCPVWRTPESFGVRITDRDFRHFNQHQYMRGETGITRVPLWSPVRIDGLSLEEQLGNLRKMREYVTVLAEFRRLRIPPDEQSGSRQRGVL